MYKFWLRNTSSDRAQSEIREYLCQIQHEVRKIMAAIDDLKAGQAALDKAVTDVVAFLKALAGKLAGGVSTEDAAAVTADLNAQASALEAAIAPVAPPVG